MGTATLNTITDFTSNLMRDADRIDKGQGIFDAPWCIYSLFVNARRGRKVIAAIRTAMALCGDNCATGACLDVHLQTTRKIRNSYITISKAADKAGLPWFTKRQITTSLAEWDEMVEDCTIASDREIRSALNDIASRL